jgi:elongation factor G
MATTLNDIRNIGVIAHIDAGKTTVTERMLYYAHFTHRVGRVDKGTTTTDYDPEEQDRGITINSACVTFDWKKKQINLIDTPGHVDFTAEVERSLRVLDGGVVVFSAREGVEAQSETVWRQADHYHVPRLAFINKMDREGADFYETLSEIEKRLEANPIVITLPVGAGPPHVNDAFRGTIDLIRMKMLTFEAASEGVGITVSDIPEDMTDDAELWRGQMLEQLSLYSDALTEVLLAEEDVSEEMIHNVLRQATLHDMAVPMLCGSALDGIGVQPLLDAVIAYLPSPADMPPVEGMQPGKEDKKLIRKPETTEPFCGLLFKIEASKHGDLNYVRVYSGELKANSRVLNPGKNAKENAPQIWRIQANRREQVPKVGPGEIIGIIGLRQTVTGDTLCDIKNPILLESIAFPETVLSMAIEPETADERKKLSAALDMMRRQDPTFLASENEETGQTLISGMGELHLEVIQHRLQRDHGVKIRVHSPRVSYRETIEKKAEILGQCHRTLGGARLTAGVRIRIEPFETPEGPPVVIESECDTELVPEVYRTAILETLEGESEGGGLFGFPLINVKITLLDAEIHESESNEMAFRMASGEAFRNALNEAGVVLLEPIMKLEVTTPEDYVGDFVGDIQQRRGMITHTHQRGRNTVIDAEAPLANLFGYASAMRGMSQGRAQCSMEPHKYGPAPPEVRESFEF